MPAYEEAVQAVYRAPLASFVAERHGQTAALRAAGDEAAAAKLAKRPRPTISAWTVNQLYWHARDAFDDMLAAAERVRAGDRTAASDHREAIARLRKRAVAILKEARRGATEATLRRVTTTLAAIAATGGFDPDLPGTLAADRDPPGFEVIAQPVRSDARLRRAESSRVRPRTRDAAAEREPARRDAARRAAEAAEKTPRGRTRAPEHRARPTRGQAQGRPSRARDTRPRGLRAPEADARGRASPGQSQERGAGTRARALRARRSG